MNIKRLSYLITFLIFGICINSLAAEYSIGDKFMPVDSRIIGGYDCQGISVKLFFSVGATANSGTNMAFAHYGHSTMHRAPLVKVEKNQAGDYRFYYEGEPPKNSDSKWFDGHPMRFMYDSKTNEATAQFRPRVDSSTGEDSDEDIVTAKAFCRPYVGGH